MLSATLITIAVSAFAYHIIGVVLMRSKKKMLRIHAMADIAFMQHQQPIWDRANELSI